MTCHLCQAEAVSRCFTCGALVCAEHNKSDTCAGCSTGIIAGDRRADRFAVEPLPKEQRHGWWRPQQADEYKPSACYECQGLARAVCRNCQSNYCRDHAGSSGLCQACGRSANLGIYVVLGVFVLVGVLLLCQWFFNR